jgi:putative hemolysin
VIVANHPTGLADGAAVWKTLRARRKDIIFFANADAMRINPRFGEVTIPVEWVLEKRTPAKTRETLKLAGEAFAQEMCVVIFPSGKLAKMIDGKFTEMEWFPTAISLARKKGAPVIPLHIDARNSSLFYFVSKFSGELRDITLFRELLNKKGSYFGMHFGPALAPDTFVGDANQLTTRLKNHVAYTMSGDPHSTFVP